MLVQGQNPELRRNNDVVAEGEGSVDADNEEVECARKTSLCILLGAPDDEFIF